MKWLSTTALLLLLIGNSMLVGATNKYLVVVAEFEGLDESNKVHKVYPAEVVSALKYDGNRVLVQRVEYQPSTMEFPERREIRNPIWLPVAVTIKPIEFVKVRAWPMNEGLFINHGPDAGDSYAFATDGAFSASAVRGNSIDDSPDENVPWEGHLYRHGDIFWARPHDKLYHNSLPHQLFILKKSDGSLCDASGSCFSARGRGYGLRLDASKI